MSPSSVSTWRRPSCRNSVRLVISSSFWIWKEMAGCVRPSCRAVSVTLPVFTTETNERRTRMSMLIKGI